MDRIISADRTDQRISRCVVFSLILNDWMGIDRDINPNLITLSGVPGRQLIVWDIAGESAVAEIEFGDPLAYAMLSGDALHDFATARSTLGYPARR